MLYSLGMHKTYPPKLKKGDVVRVVAPARSLAIISKQTREIANSRFEQMGLELSFGKHVEECDEFGSTTVEARVADLHEAFSDPDVKGVITAIGGFNSNQLLKHLDWDLIGKNPKMFCGYSDITALCNAIYVKTGLVTFYGPHYSTFGQKLYMDYTMDYFKKCVMEGGGATFEAQASENWSDDMWFLDQDKRAPARNGGFVVLGGNGVACGTAIGGNLCTFNLLHGTEFMPDFAETVLFLEDDETTNAVTFDRDLQSVIHQPGFEGVNAIVIGRFQKNSEVRLELLQKIVESKQELADVVVVAGADFGHTEPKFTWPVGGVAKVEVSGKKARISFEV